MHAQKNKETQVNTPMIVIEERDVPINTQKINHVPQTKPFLLQISINSVEEMVEHAMNHDLKPVEICHNEKDCAIGIFHFGPNQHHHFEDLGLQ